MRPKSARTYTDMLAKFRREHPPIPNATSDADVLSAFRGDGSSQRTDAHHHTRKA